MSTEEQKGCSIDVSSCTCIIAGKELIKALMEPAREHLNHDAMAYYNKVALGIVKFHGKAFGIDIDNIPTPEKWSLATLTKEDTDYMRSFLSVKELGRSEIVTQTTTYEITPVEGY